MSDIISTWLLQAEANIVYCMFCIQKHLTWSGRKPQPSNRTVQAIVHTDFFAHFLGHFPLRLNVTLVAQQHAAHPCWCILGTKKKRERERRSCMSSAWWRGFSSSCSSSAHRELLCCMQAGSGSLFWLRVCSTLPQSRLDFSSAHQQSPQPCSHC